MKRIISLVLLSLCIIAVCVPLYSCESTESGGQTGRQFAYGELVCISMVSMSSVNPYETLDFNYSEIARIKEKLLYISPDLMMFSTVVYENDIQPVWEETGTLSKSSLDFKFIDSETKWSEGHSLQHITENVESVYSQATDTDQTIQLILLKDQTAYLAVCSKNSETVYLLEETDISYHEDIRRPSFEVFTFTASGNAEEYTVFKKNVLCFYNNRTEFFLQCAENTAGGIHGKVTETRDGYLLETNDGKYKLIVHTDNDTMYLTAESPESIKFCEDIIANTGTDLKKSGEYYTVLNQNSVCFDTWEADFDGDGNQEQISFHRFKNYYPMSISCIEDLSVPSYRINAAVWKNGEIKHFVFLPFENIVSDIRFFEGENGELFAEADVIEYRLHHYSGVSLPSYWEPYTETVVYKVTVDEKGIYFEKVQKTA